MRDLQPAIERLCALGEVEHDADARHVFMEFRDALTQGKIRAAEKSGDQWVVNTWVKQGILLG
ncbi:MAG TPA: 2,3,4,5-tetrahydropyridine-2,6-dicarboxylate N-succinyltransferase, partial [Terriglobales bacterium]|nr:2,3,4,5-tetrahydropyridine-2,6-dicarboxylate N-succinyltransferase [Terriglobales bacterium]